MQKIFNRRILALTALMLACATTLAQQPKETHHDSTARVLEEVIINASRADNKTPLTTTTLRRTELEEGKIVPSVPYMLNLQPSVEATGENGMVGNTTMRIRGVDATRINVNINGITLNDPESQSVYWVNIPNLAGMAQSMQIQRGMGASNGGGNSFGGSINLQTLNANSTPYARADIGLGSWNTRQYGITAGTGIGQKGFAFDMAYNGMTTDGFIRGGKGDQQSVFMSGGYYGDRSLLKAVVILGRQMTGVCWDGADSATLDNDPTYNSDGMYYDEVGNVRFYNKESDNYKQQHYQLYYSYLLNDNWTLNAALDYTHGFGYTDRYKYNKKWSKYGMSALDTANALYAAKSDFILNKFMDNDAYTENLSARFQKGPMTLTIGETGLYFGGAHYDQVVWTKDSNSVSDDHPFTYDSNYAVKKDLTLYAKMNYDFSSRSNIYADLQFRLVDYNINGSDEDYPVIDYSNTFRFFNPKLGWNYLLNDNSRLYVVAGINHREPTRADIKDAVGSGATIEPESMLDIEMGYANNNDKFSYHANGYAMIYKDQLTPTGMITESGYALMENVAKSYRLGIELEGGYRFTRWFDLSGNLTLSTNKIVDYNYVYCNGADSNWNATYDTLALGTTDLAFSPSIIGAAVAAFHPTKGWTIQLTGKYVGKQYCDNTSREPMAQQPYFLLNFSTSYTWQLSNDHELQLQVLVNNILNNKYRTNAWASYGYDWDSAVVYSRGYFQQPGTNWAVRMVLTL